MVDHVATDDEAIEAWLGWLRGSRGRSARTIDAYRGYIGRLREYLAQDGVAVLDAQKQQLEIFSGLWLSKKGVVARSRIPYISAIRGFYAFARHHEYITGRADPAKELGHPKTGRKLPRTITLANAERLMWAPDLSTFKGVRDATMMSLLIGCGIRVGGLVGMNESSLRTRHQDGQLRMDVLVREKGDRERWLPVPREAEMLLRVYLEHEDLAAIDRSITNADNRPDRVLFVSVRSTLDRSELEPGEQRRLTKKAVNEMIQGYGLKLGIPSDQLHPHAMRHLFGTELAEDDVPTASAADLLGHADPKSTAIYQQLAMKKKTALVDSAAPLAKMKTPVSELLKRLPK